MTKEKDILLFIHSAPVTGVDDIRKFKTPSGKTPRIAVIGDSKLRKWQELAKINGADIIIATDLSKPLKIAKSLLPYQEELLAVISRNEAKMSEFAKIVPHVPYLKTPTAESLRWASDKIAMRERLYLYDKKITPKFTVVQDSSVQSIEKVETKLNFPIIIKPSGLAASRLVTLCYHKEEFETSLNKVFRKINSVYKQTKVTTKPRVLVEEFMEGSMYSIDGYVNSRGKIYFCPMVYIKTGKSIGFEDFFGYMQICPTQLKQKSIDKAEVVATKAVHALGLRSCTAHIELMRTEDGWKVIEVGARVGGFRHHMYQHSFDFNHTLNDIRIRVPQKPIIKKKINGYTVAMKFFAKKEGVLKSLQGVKKIKGLESYVEIMQRKKIGSKCSFAKNGGSSVVNLILFNKNRSALFSDIRRAEQSLKIVVE